MRIRLHGRVYTCEMAEDFIIQMVLQYRYWILIPFAIFEGPIIAFVAGALVSFGYLNIFITYAILLLGDIVPDIAYYLFGRYGNQKALITRLAGNIGITEDHFDTIRHLWDNHPNKTMVFTKFAYGLSTPLLVSAGVVGMSLGRFLRSSLPISILQAAILMMIGYYFGNSFKLVSDTLYAVQVAVGGIAVIAIAYYFFVRYMRQKLVREELSI